jgi:predicted membrane protein
MIARCLPAVAAVLLLSGCIVVGHKETISEMRYDSRSFDKDASKEVHLNLTMGAGDLKVESGSRKLVDADFVYNVPAWRPTVSYTTANSVGELTIEQPGHTHTTLGNSHYEWDLRVNEEVPLDVTVNFGAGKANLNLGHLALRDVDLNMGVGQLDMDLRGRPKHDYDVRINGGVGQATVHVPSDVGVYAEASGGIGHIEVKGLNKRDGHWENDAYANSPVKIHVNISGGIGEIRLIGDNEEPPAAL